ncbi:nucleoid-associated bacterial protein [Clostridium botulinum]|uniref:nucleoid-associated protein n=2 Tax=Clostridium botulinum TaxID=1491 RepID=UPI0004B1DF5D|nr:nucleoid-associated protein [Clostridium botulinum]APH22365.1 37-kD nucleoid-associated bacterial family protein [Clostridium botulinum]AUN23183.1 nucleoid-associated bacterial protein [Clostridium botulinum]MBN3372135.1 nucleoid-associated protein [Clostridium botulinum]MBN3375931.1 nucleoid-associated protein [Clostridium botulinum]MBN3380514.1 nucleoid-associated protein [Clostridium botulinum]
MEYIKEVNINEAVVHILDNNSEEPVLNEYKLRLDDECYKYILKLIDKCLKDECLRYAKFNEEKNVVKEISQEYLNGQNDLLDVSKELARQLFILMKGNDSISSCDLMIVSISTEYGPMLAILKMDYVKNYIHVVDMVENKVGIDIVPEFTGLPASAQKIQKCAFIKPIRENQEFNLMVIDKQKKIKTSEEYGSNYFINKYLGCNIIENERDSTKAFVQATEKWSKINLNEDAATSEKIIRTVGKLLKEKDTIDIEEVSNDIFGENSDAKLNYEGFIAEQGIKEKIDVDKEWVDKKFKRIRLKIDRDIDLYIDKESYHDDSRFEVKRVGDGSVNIIIKNVYNYMQKISRK